MTFASDAQRRWFFANLATGGGASSGTSGNSGSSPSPDSSEGGTFTSTVVTNARPIDVDSGQARRDARIAYAQAMYPELSEPDALRKLNDRNG